ncbi:Oidioi.mRNA.OKI2018_I69.XSR.g16503.t1.cds [Oikopleura dioica]|uniref:Oidioi.mRNA.OKI2018_I69.XSR.g16503.t1.cds n=1 Tax=Oikopleura dioica TaxID=34765 RepID=A0ABN7SK91_OIKDI|nr:Oidioi.mRNA.OKI2018_I69.XSR.g16503.t1.cds [Oikopleura dioica]
MSKPSKTKTKNFKYKEALFAAEEATRKRELERIVKDIPPTKGMGHYLNRVDRRLMSERELIEVMWLLALGQRDFNFKIRMSAAIDMEEFGWSLRYKISRKRGEHFHKITLKRKVGLTPRFNLILEEFDAVEMRNLNEATSIAKSINRQVVAIKVGSIVSGMNNGSIRFNFSLDPILHSRASELKNHQERN